MGSIQLGLGQIDLRWMVGSRFGFSDDEARRLGYISRCVMPGPPHPVIWTTGCAVNFLTMFFFSLQVTYSKTIFLIGHCIHLRIWKLKKFTTMAEDHKKFCYRLHIYFVILNQKHWKVKLNIYKISGLTQMSSLLTSALLRNKWRKIVRYMCVSQWFGRGTYCKGIPTVIVN